jgi:hypothetical protein
MPCWATFLENGKLPTSFVSRDTDFFNASSISHKGSDRPVTEVYQNRELYSSKSRSN